MATKVSIPALIQALGGKENLAQATHCATRLRVTTRDKSKIDEAALKAIPGVLGVVNNGTQTQIIIGAEVNNVYKDFIAQAGVDEEAPIDENLDLKDELKNKKGNAYLITMLPAAFMTSVCTTYLCVAKIGFNMPLSWNCIIGPVVFVLSIAIFYYLKATKTGRD